MMTASVTCFGCGKGIVQASNRYRMIGPMCINALPVWRRLISEKLSSMDVEVDIDKLIYDEEDGFCGRMCRSCTSALERLGRLEAGTKKNIDDAVEEIMNGDRWSKVLSSDMDAAVNIMVASPPENVEAGRSNHAINVPSLPRKDDSDEDVAVKFILYNNLHLISIYYIGGSL